MAANAGAPSGAARRSRANPRRRTARPTVVSALFAAAAGVGGATPANAPDAAAVAIEEVIVIGSLIKRRTVYDGRAPVESLDKALFESMGAAQPVDVLKALTANTGSILATQQNYLQGTSQFSLRGLGLSSTLTLVNGRRAGLAPVSNDAGQGFFDINTLPMAMIERIEVLRDGASATYGSQAVAGVANIVTRQGFEGLEFSGGYRSATNTAFDAGFAAGLASANSQVNLYGAYYEQDENFRTDFDWMTPRAIDPNGDGDIVDGSFDSGRGSPGSFRRAVANADGTYSPLRIAGVDAPRVPDADCRAAGGYPSGALCRMSFADQRTMIAAERRMQFFTEAEIDLTDRLTLFSEVGYSANEVTDRVGNLLLFNGNVERTNEFFVPANHPFNFWIDPDGDGVPTYVPPADWRPGEHEAVALGYFGRPLGAEANGDAADEERREFDNLRALIGLKADFGGSWTATAYAGHGDSDFNLTSGRHWIAAEFARVVAEGLWNPFGTRLVAPELVTPKTVADDGLAPGLVGARAANDAQTFALFASTKLETAETSQSVLEITASGDLFAWRERTVALAVGAQLRDLRYAQRPDALNAAGGGPQAIREFPKQAEQRAWAAFAESLLPLGAIAELQLALRHENYDRAGSTTDPKIAAQWFATDWLSLRGSFGTSFQAPSVFQTAGNTSSRTLADPFRFDSQGIGRCTVDAAGAILNRGDNFNSMTILRGGALTPQSAESWNVGLLLQPVSAAEFSLDLWAIDYQDVIAQGRSFQAIVDDDCRDDGVPNDPRVQRDSSGQLSAVTTDYENIAVVRSQGIDFNAHYDMTFPWGEIRVNGAATLLTGFDVDAAGAGFVDQLGSRNDINGFGPTPELRWNLGVEWRLAGHRAHLTLRRIGAYANDEVATRPEIAAWTTLDAQYSYAFDSLAGGDATIHLGAGNLTGEDPPALPSGRDGVQRYNLRPGFDGLVHDIKGRTLYLRFRYRMDR